MSDCPVNIDLISSDEYIGDSLTKINNNFSTLLTDACNVETRVEERVNIRTFFYYGPNSASDATSGMNDNTASRPSDLTIEAFVNDTNKLNLPSISENGDIAYVIYQKTGWYKQQDNYYREGAGSVPFQRTVRVPVLRRIGICFAPGTQIQTPSGNKSIEDIVIDDLVYSFDPITKQKITSKVLKTHKNSWEEGGENSPLLEITHEKGTLSVTAEHWIYIGDEQKPFKAAKNLTTNDSIILDDNTKSKIISIDYKTKYEFVYNLNVEKYHNFIANNVIVGDYEADENIVLEPFSNNTFTDSIKGTYIPGNEILVTTPAGTVNIKNLSVGDKVYGFDSKTLNLVEQTIQRIQKLQLKKYLRIRHQFGALVVSPEHLVYSQGKYVLAKELKNENILTILEDTKIYKPYFNRESKILNIQQVNSDLEYIQIEVTGTNNYIANNVFVHNGGGGCFPANTIISTPKGEVKIQDIKVGDIVYGFNNNTSEIGEYEVEETYQHNWEEVGVTSPLIEIKHEKGSITLTRNHWVYVDEGGLYGEENKYLEAGDLKTGNTLTLKDGTKSIIQGIIEIGEYTTVYNFEVKDAHNYIASNVRVHNGGGGGKGGGGKRRAPVYRTVWEPRIETYYVGYNWSTIISDTYAYYSPIFIIYRLTYNSNIKRYLMDSGFPKFTRASTASTLLWNQPQAWSTY